MTVLQDIAASEEGTDSISSETIVIASKSDTLDEPFIMKRCSSDCDLLLVDLWCFFIGEVEVCYH